MRVENFADEALRTLCVAYCDYNEAEFTKLLDFKPGSELDEGQSKILADDCQHRMTLIGIFGIEDPLRDGVPEAVARCQKAGVFVRMVTGDNVRTAKAIAIKCGIYMKGGIILEGSRFRKMTDAEIDNILPVCITVIAHESYEYF